MGRRENRGFEGGVIANPTATWLAFLASPGAPKTALSPLELDGYLTGIIVSPQPAAIMPSRWLGGLWSEDEPVFEDEKQINLVLGAVMDHYNALIKEIDRSLKRLEASRICDYRPMFLTDNGKPPHDTVRIWVRGFWKAMALTPEAWRALAGGKRGQVLIGPFVGFFEFEDQEPFELRDDAEVLLDEDAAAIPQTILALRKLSKIRSRSITPARSSKIGRNDPCPCGSGRKYKLCCGKN
jgi:uncharacterized protein